MAVTVMLMASSKKEAQVDGTKDLRVLSKEYKLNTKSRGHEYFLVPFFMSMSLSYFLLERAYQTIFDLNTMWIFFLRREPFINPDCRLYREKYVAIKKPSCCPQVSTLHVEQITEAARICVCPHLTDG